MAFLQRRQLAVDCKVERFVVVHPATTATDHKMHDHCQAEKTNVHHLYRNRNQPWFSDGYVTVFCKFQKWPNPTTNACNNNLITVQARLQPAPFEVTV